MQEIVFIEHAQDLRYVHACLAHQSMDPSRLLVVNLDEELDGAFDSRLTVKVEDDYFTGDLYEGINEQADSLTQALSSDSSLRELFTVEGVSMLDVVMKDFSRYFVWVLKRRKLIRRIFEIEKMDLAHLFPDSPAALTGILPNASEKIVNFLVLNETDRKNNPRFACKVWDQDFQIDAASDSRPRLSLKRLMAEGAADWLRKFSNASSKSSGKNKKALLFFGNPALLFPILEQAVKSGERRILYYQDRIAPRICQQLWNKGVGYYVFRDFEKKPEDISSKSTGLEAPVPFQANGFSSSLRVCFMSDGLDFSGPVAERLNYLQQVKMPELIRKAKAFKALFRTHQARCVVIDQDITEYNKLFILVARAEGVSSAEMLHGVPAYLMAAPLSCDLRLVWGPHIQRRYELFDPDESRRVVVTGNPKYDSLIALRKDECRKKVMSDFGIPTGKKIVLFTTQPYKSGNNVGLVHVHITRHEKENNVRQVLRGLDGKDVHLIIKLHPNEQKSDFESDLVRDEGYKGSFSVIQRYSIYTLLAASDLLITTHSNTVLEALILNTPVITINFTGRPDIHPYAQWRGARGIYQPEKLGPEIETMLSLGEASILQEAREKIIREFAYKVDGHSAERVYEEVEKLIEARAETEKEENPKLVQAGSTR